jgi:putative methyltransferase (TIGR04325 family)
MNGVLKSLLPPILVDLAARLRPVGCTWSGNYATWTDAVADSTGYDSNVIFERVEAAALRVKRGEAVYERDSVIFDRVEYSWPLLASLMWIAARTSGRLNVLDFGGALGSTFFQNRRFLQSLAEVRWNIVEQPQFVEAGRRHFAGDQLRFYGSVDECFDESAPSILLLSSVLQYLERPYDVIDDISRRFRFVLVDLTPVHDEERDRLTVQNVPPTIYPARYPCWIFSERRLMEAFGGRFDLVADFDAYLGQNLHAGWSRFNYRGLIFERRGDAATMRPIS